MNTEFEKFVRIAIEQEKLSLREGNNGFGAVIIKENKIISTAHDTEETEKDPTAHAEINAIKKATKKIGKNLHNCIIISTHEPCPMCSTAMIWSNLNKLVYGYSINETIKQGRKRIRINCMEIFAKANIEIEIIENVLFDECSLLYNKDIRKEMKKLRNVKKQQLKNYNYESIEKRLKWYKTVNNDENVNNIDIKEKAYKILLQKLNIDEESAPIIEKTNKKIVFHSMNFCPTLEACKILNLDTRKICKLYNENATDVLIKQIDKNLRFVRNYKKLRPYSEYCEEMVIDEREL